MWLQLHYDSAPVHLGSLESSVWVFALLGAFYAVLGALVVLTDGLVEDGAMLQGEKAQRAHRQVRTGDRTCTASLTPCQKRATGRSITWTPAT